MIVDTNKMEDRNKPLAEARKVKGAEGFGDHPGGAREVDWDAYLPQQTLDPSLMRLIRQNVSLLDLATEVKENRSGSFSHQMRCPKCDSSRCFIDTSDNHYYCFSCNDLGDPIRYYQHMHGLSFKDSMEALKGFLPGFITAYDAANSDYRRLMDLLKSWRCQFPNDLGYIAVIEPVFKDEITDVKQVFDQVLLLLKTYRKRLIISF